MKKLMLVAALVAATVAFAANPQGIKSKNTVGYSKIRITPGLNLIGTAFLKVDDEMRPDLNATFADAKGKATTGEGDDVADFIQVFDSTMKGYPNAFFFYDSEDPDPELDPYRFKWLDNKEQEIADFVIPSANAFWYTARGEFEFELTTLGAVGRESVEVTLKPGLNCIVNPFPCDLPLNGDFVNWKDAGCVTGEGDDVADFIQVFDQDMVGYPNAFFFYNSEDPDPELDDYRFKWLDNKEQEITDYAVPAGGGFWFTYRGDKDITLTFKSPIAEN